MAKVPVYDAPQVGMAAPQTPAYTANGPANSIGKEQQDLGKGVLQLGMSASQVVLGEMDEANRSRIIESRSAMTRGETELRQNLSQLEGKNALDRRDEKNNPISLADEAIQKFDKYAEGVESGLSNDVQRNAFTNYKTERREALRGYITDHTIKQQRVYDTSVDHEAIKDAQDAGAAEWGGVNGQKAFAKASGEINEALTRISKREGHPPEWLANETKKALAPIFMATADGMIKAGMAKQAEAYLIENGESMNATTRQRISEKVQPALIYQDAEVAVNEIWGADGPTNVNDPVKIFDMEKKAEAMFPGDPDRAKHAKALLKEKAGVWNAQQMEVNAGNTNGVYAYLDKGMSLAQVRKTDEFNSLPNKDREKLINEWLSAKDAKVGHQLAIIRDTENLNLYGNEDAYITANDPTVLAQMKTRAQVEALRPKFGMVATQRLAEKWDELQKPGAIRDAVYDTDSFNKFADKFGYKPYDKSLSEAGKRQLGMLKVNVENKIEIEQQRLKRQLSRSEKDALMEAELSKPKVTVDPGTFSRNKEMLPIQMGAEDVTRAKPTPAQRADIAAALQQMHAAFPNDPRYMATDENVMAHFRKSLQIK